MTATVVGKSPEHLVLDGHDRQGRARRRARQRPGDQRRRPRRQGRAGRLRRRAGRPDHRQLDGGLGADRHEHRDRASCSRRSATPTTCCCSTCRPTRRPTRANTSSPRAPSPSPDDSLYPPGILIGQVTSVNEESAYKSVNVHPLANLHNLDVVQVLTRGAGTRAVQPQRASPPALPAGQARRVRDAAANSSPRREPADDGGRHRPALLARVAALSVVVVFFQIGVVSEVPVFGVNADLSPAAGRVRRAAVRLDARRGRRASRSGCSSTWRSLQTLGLTSLDLHADRLLGRAAARTARPAGRADAAARRRRGRGGSRWSATR